MKALSLRQPWAWAIAHAGKRLENRTWPLLRRGVDALERCPLGGIARGERFAIHASQKLMPADVAGVRRAADRNLPPAALMRSAVVAVATVVDVVVADSTWEQQIDGGARWRLTERWGLEVANDQIDRWWMGPYALVLDDVIALPDPIGSIQGRLYFWDLTDVVADMVTRQIARAA